MLFTTFCQRYSPIQVAINWQWCENSKQTLNGVFSLYIYSPRSSSSSPCWWWIDYHYLIVIYSATFRPRQKQQDVMQQLVWSHLYFFFILLWKNLTEFFLLKKCLFSWQDNVFLLSYSGRFSLNTQSEPNGMLSCTWIQVRFRQKFWNHVWVEFSQTLCLTGVILV